MSQRYSFPSPFPQPRTLREAYANVEAARQRVDAAFEALEPGYLDKYLDLPITPLAEIQSQPPAREILDADTLGREAVKWAERLRDGSLQRTDFQKVLRYLSALSRSPEAEQTPNVQRLRRVMGHTTTLVPSARETMHRVLMSLYRPIPRKKSPVAFDAEQYAQLTGGVVAIMLSDWRVEDRASMLVSAYTTDGGCVQVRLFHGYTKHGHFEGVRK